VGFFTDLFGAKPYPSHSAPEVEKLLSELIQIGKTDDYLSERPGPPFNMQCRHLRARAIGKRFDEIGGLKMMEYAHQVVRKKLGKVLISHLEYAWTDIGEWKY
jgi:hypothetical protein